MTMRMIQAWMLAGLLLGGNAAAAPPDAATLQAIEATAHDYMDGQLEGDVARVTRALHPDLAKRNVVANPLHPRRRVEDTTRPMAAQHHRAGGG